MKQILVIMINVFFCAGVLPAQENYYSTTKTFYESGYTYQCDVAPSDYITLYNTNNIWTYIDQVYKATGQVPPTGNDYPEVLEEDNWTKQKCFAIVNNTFSATEKLRVEGRDFLISLYINSDTGRIVDVEFNFTTFSPYATIPISVYRTIETNLKQQVWFTPTADGKKMNYILLYWRQEPK